MRRKLLLITAAAFALAGSMMLLRREAAAPVSAAKVSSVAGPRWDGRRVTLAVTWSASTHGALAPDQTQMAVDTNVEADVALEGLAPGQLVVSYLKVRDFRFRMQGQDVAVDAAQLAKQLEGKEAVLTLDARGAVTAIAFDDALEPPIRTALRSLAQHLQYSLDTGDAWIARETTPIGLAHVQYKRDAGRILRTRPAYETVEAVRGPAAGQTVRGEGALTVDADGLPVSLDEREQFHCDKLDAQWTFSYRRVSVQRAERRGAPAVAAAQPIEKRIDDPGLAHRRDERLAAKISFDQLAAEPERFQQGIKHAADFLPRAAAFLRLHPEAAQKLARLFPALNVKGRGFLLDMLAMAGDRNAQSVMCDVLAQRSGKGDEYQRLVQRFTFVTKPEPESVAFLERAYREALTSKDVASAQGAVVSLGATLDRLQRSGNESLAHAYSAELSDDLRKTKSPEVQRALLSALGNAKRPENVAQIAAFADAEEPLVRAQAAVSLRQVESPEARTALLKLAADWNSDVALHAVSSLRQQRLAADDFRALRALAESRKLSTDADAELVKLLREQGDRAGSERDAILTALLQRNQTAESDLGAVIQEMLQKG